MLKNGFYRVRHTKSQREGVMEFRFEVESCCSDLVIGAASVSVFWEDTLNAGVVSVDDLSSLEIVGEITELEYKKF